MELDVLKAELSAANEAVVAAEKALKKAQDSESDMEIKVAELKILCDDAKAAVESIDSKMSSCSTDLKKLSKEKANLLKLMETSELESKKLSLEVAQMKKDSTSNSRLVSSMLKKYPWIETEEHAFGVPGSDYDFEHSQLGEMKDQLKTLQNEQNTLAKGINKKVMGMIEKAEGEYTELLRKRKVVDNDRKKIQAVIEELDVKKKSELQRTWVKVNADFGSIFSTLLPGASAKLEPPEGMEAWEGLEVKVAFGNVWKESLSELSGGQRSLLALSLILSLLLFKPAPMYILDEVDAALDLSHTQNIGSMLRTHFAHSQFIVVSLKEGMFNNANVIFRTKFVDGVSTVTRTIGAGATMKSRPLLLNDENGSNTNSGSTSPARKRVARNAVNEGSVVGKEN
jgi:structural maintenance of chromosome 2